MITDARARADTAETEARADTCIGTDGQALVEALIAALPGPTVDRPLHYQITSAIVDWPCAQVITVEVRSVCHRNAGKPHDVTIDLEDRMVGGKGVPKGIAAAIVAALKACS